MNVDRGEFMRLCAAIALVGCPGGRDAEAPVPAVEVEPATSAQRSVDLEEETPEPCPEERETSSACPQVSSACEGLRPECFSLADDLRPSIANAWAACMARARPPKCRDNELGACMRAAVENSCALPEMLDRCERVMAACRKAGLEPKYTLTQCGQVASAVKTSDDPMGWEQVNWKRMGPSSSAEACSLEYVLPYQPFGFMWR